ncbi:MAG: zf-HC2 domain-containing protein [Gaiellaceae bacterium]
MVRPVVCERVRAQVSLQLDGELSELERRLMESHLTRCPSCGAFEQDVVSLTQSLRDAPLERSRNPVVVHAPRRVSFARIQGGVAAAVAVVAFGVAVQFAGSEPEQQLPATGSSLGASFHVETDDELAREVRQIIADGRAYDRRTKNVGTAVPI